MTKRQKLYLLAAGLLTVVALVVILPRLGLAGVLGNGGKQAAQNASDLPVNVIRVQPETEYEVTRSYTGVLRAQQDVTLGFELGGRVVSVNVDEGEIVAEGDLIAELDIAQWNAERKAAVARLNEAEAVLAELKKGPRKEVILAAEANVLAAKSEYENARFNTSRRRELAESQAISKEEFDQSKFAEQAAFARWQAAQERVNELKAGTRSEQIRAAEASVAQASAAISQIDVKLSQSVIKAPFSGAVTIRHVDRGSIVTTGTPVAQLQQHVQLEAKFGLPVATAASLEIGQELSVSVDGKDYQGAVKSRVRNLSRTTRTQSVIIELANGETDPIVAGQVCKLSLSQSVQGTGYWVPTSALTQGVRGLWSVLVVDEESGTSIARKNDVVILYSDVDRSFVSGTLSGDIRVIVDGVHRIVPGQRVSCKEVRPAKNPSVKLP